MKPRLRRRTVRYCSRPTRLAAWARLWVEWRRAGRIWEKRRSEPEREREVTSQYGHHVAVHVLRSTLAVSDFVDGLNADPCGIRPTRSIGQRPAVPRLVIAIASGFSGRAGQV